MHRRIFEDEHEWFRDAVRGFVAARVTPHRERFRAEHAIDRETWRDVGERGLLGLGVPTEYGGSGVDDFRFNAVLGEELAVAGLAYASSFGIQTDVVAPYLTELASDEQRARWLPGFCRGELVTAIGMTEPGAGSDLAALRTTARRVGGDWLLSGAKTFITNGFGADLVVLAARTSAGRSGITLFAVETDAPGFVRGRKLEKIGQDEADTAELFLEDVRVSDAAVLGEVDAGFRHMMERLPQERISTACVNVAHAYAALADTLVYVRERQAFGRPIGSFQHNQFVLAELSTTLDVTRAYVDRCLQEHVDGALDPVDAAKAKWWSAEVQNRVLDACVQLHGGYGYMREYDVARAWADARVTKIWAGSNEIMKHLIARDLELEAPR